MHQPMQGAAQMTEDEFKRNYLYEWPADQIAKQRDDVLRGKQYGLSVSQIASDLQMRRSEVQRILLEEDSPNRFHSPR